MIFVTVGTQLPFDRLMQGMDMWAEAHPDTEIFAQTSELGADNYTPRHYAHAPRVSPTEFDRRCAEAQVIVAHAGTGSLIGAMTLGKPILVMPRRAEFREHRNDHQLATVDRFGSREGVHVATTPEEVGPALDRILAQPDSAPKLPPFAEDRLIHALRDVIFADPT